jgi:hypothetical protein
MVDAMSEAGWSPAGSDGTYQYATAALSVFWPEEQFRILVARWPHLAARVGATWDEHRRRVEQHRAFLDQEGLRFQQLPGDVSSLVTFLAARKVTKPGDDPDDGVAAGTNRAVLVRLGTQVQAVLPPVRARHPGRRQHQDLRPSRRWPSLIDQPAHPPVTPPGDRTTALECPRPLVCPRRPR